MFIAEGNREFGGSARAPVLKKRSGRVRTRGVFSGAELTGEEPGAAAAPRWRRARRASRGCFYSCCTKQRESLGAAAARCAGRAQGATEFPAFLARDEEPTCHLKGDSPCSGVMQLLSV